jgi:hypothetical protein
MQAVGTLSHGDSGFDAMGFTGNGQNVGSTSSTTIWP